MLFISLLLHAYLLNVYIHFLERIAMRNVYKYFQGFFEKYEHYL